MSVSYVTGDLFKPATWVGDVHDTLPDAYGHGVNCKGLMGSGIAPLFRDALPAMYKLYKRACDLELLLPGMVLPYKHVGITVFNIASQYNPGANADLDFLEMGLLYCRFYMRNHGITHLALPRIGAGIGGLEWESVKHVVEDLFGDAEDMHVTLVSLEGA